MAVTLHEPAAPARRDIPAHPARRRLPRPVLRAALRALGRSPVAQFALSGLLATVAIGIVGMEVGHRIGTRTAIHDAQHTARLAGEGIVAPAVTAGVAHGDPAAVAALDERVRAHVLRHGIVRVKLWASDGRIVYSDERDLIGRRFELGTEQRKVMSRGGVQAEISPLARPENRFEGGDEERKLLEVYLPIRGADGERYLFEAYQGFSSVAAGGNRLWTAFAPALLGLLILLQLVNLPFARALARQLQRGTREREALLRRAVEASETERRGIAADLHDGVVQDLVSVCYGLNARADELTSQGHTAAGAALREGAAQTREGVRALRTLLVDIYPPTLQEAGLYPALEDLAATITSRGVATSVVAPADLPISDAQARLLFRCAQEALRNAVKHANGALAWIEATRDGDRVVLEIGDDGDGYDAARLRDKPAQGHIGLRSLGDLVRDAGGALEVRSAPGEGTVVEVSLPLASCPLAA